MKKIALILALAASCANAVGATPAESVAAFHHALASGDQNAALALLSEDVVIFESGYVERSRAEYAAHHLADDIAFSKTTTRKATWHAEHTDGERATVLEQATTTGTFKGRRVHSLGLETALLERRGDGWVIVHLHWSARKAK